MAYFIRPALCMSVKSACGCHSKEARKRMAELADVHKTFCLPDFQWKKKIPTIGLGEKVPASLKLMKADILVFLMTL